MKHVVWTLIGFSLAPVMVLAQAVDPAQVSADPAEDPAGNSGAGYIALAALVVIVIIYVLLKKQHRKFNE